MINIDSGLETAVNGEVTGALRQFSKFTITRFRLMNVTGVGQWSLEEGIEINADISERTEPNPPGRKKMKKMSTWNRVRSTKMKGAFVRSVNILHYFTSFKM